MTEMEKAPFNVFRVSTRDGLTVLFSFASQADQSAFYENAVVEVNIPATRDFTAASTRVCPCDVLFDLIPPDYSEFSRRYRVFLPLLDARWLSDRVGHERAMWVCDHRKTVPIRIYEGTLYEDFTVGDENLMLELEYGEQGLKGPNSDLIREMLKDIATRGPIPLPKRGKKR